MTMWSPLPVIGATCFQLAVAQACQEGNYLDGLAQAHLISQNASCLLAVQFPHPPDTCLLIPGQQKQTFCHTKRSPSTNTNTVADELIIGPLSLLILDEWAISVAQLMCCKTPLEHNSRALLSKSKALHPSPPLQLSFRDS